MELFELVELLPRRCEGDWSADDFLDRQCSTAASVAVHLRHDDAVDFQRVVEGLGGLNCILTGHCIDDEECVVGVDSARDEANLLHHFGVDRQATGGVDNDDVATKALGLFETFRCREDRILRIGEHRHVDLTAERAELLNGCRALEVSTNHHRVASLCLEPCGKLGRVRGLTRALQTCHQDDGRRL